jgi:hypothetical protein
MRSSMLIRLTPTDTRGCWAYIKPHILYSLYIAGCSMPAFLTHIPRSAWSFTYSGFNSQPR